MVKREGVLPVTGQRRAVDVRVHEAAVRRSGSVPYLRIIRPRSVLAQLLLRVGQVLPILCLGGVIQCRQAPRSLNLVTAPSDRGASEAVSPETLSLMNLAADDPLGFLRYCRESCAKNIRAYRCIFLKQERIRGVLGAEQEIEVVFREEPFSVHMKWLRNPGGAEEAVYVAGELRDEEGRELGRFKPAGVIGLLVDEVTLPIDGKEARKDSRRTLNQFGFRNTLDLIVKYCDAALTSPEYSLKFTGVGKIGGRSTLTFERMLPYSGEDGAYPDRLLEVHIDQAWLVPLGCFAYADDRKERLLGSYVFTDVELNPKDAWPAADRLAVSDP